MLSTPVTPAAVLGTADPRPKEVPTRECGWRALDIYWALHEVWSESGPRDATAEKKKSAYRELVALIDRCPNRNLEGLLYSGWTHRGVHGNDQRAYNLVEKVAALADAYHKVVDSRLFDIWREYDSLLADELEAAGVTVSRSAYNADENCLTIYVAGQPVTWI